MSDDPAADEIVAAMLEAGRARRVSWQRVAAILAGRGVVGRDGRPLKPDAVRKAYRRMQDRTAPVAAKRVSQKREPVPPVFVEGEAPVPPAARAVPPPAADALGHIKAGWAAGKTPMPKPLK